MSESIFHILYKLPGFNEQRCSYSALGIDSLLKMLHRTENISILTTEKLFIHQVLPDGSVLELVSHDKAPGVKPRIKLKLESKENEVIALVHEALTQAAQEPLPPLKGRITEGYGIHAYEARSGK